jgi:alpha-N-arabinofuranosidase
MKHQVFIIILLIQSLLLSAQIAPVKIKIQSNQIGYKINKEIYGQFAEHLGTCIYGGLWVGEKSSTPNINGYRKDVFEALKELQIPVLRWPGGCFADEYHWMDGIGTKTKRPKMVNNNWGGVVEDNSFGTHEFLNLCEMLGCEPYISGNVGSGTVEEMAKWVEYMTSDGESTMANLRRQNGREKPWNVKYLGVGNESWGCGGNMTPAYYSDLYRRYSTYCREFGNNKLYKIASGASDYDYNWTETLMKNVGGRMNGLSLHYYTIKSWSDKGSATKFNTDEYLGTMAKCLEIEDIVKKHIAIMDKYDPKNKIGLLVDEWGTWFDQEPGTHPGFLYQQNTMRDAFVAAQTLNIFNKYTERVKMANIAQIVNVLQAMILTDSSRMVLTPTYYVFKMYKGHMGATYIPLDIQGNQLTLKDKKFPSVSVSASKNGNGKILITLANIDPENDQKIEIEFPELKTTKITGTILTAKGIDSYNTFEKPNEVVPAIFKGAKLTKTGIALQLPAKSIVALEL